MSLITTELNKTLNIISIQVSEALEFESDDDEIEFENNKAVKKKVSDFIHDIFELKNKNRLSQSDYDDLLNKSLQIFSDNTGCAEDLEILEFFLDPLYDMGIIDTKKYASIVSNSASNRWQ